MSRENRSKFYANLPEITDFFNASNSEPYHQLPDDWLVAATDIINSTEAIQKEQYKTVNILGASPIVGILNIAERHSIPYTFGGDGAIFCIPPDLFDQAKEVLAACKKIGETEYGLDLRAAIIPASYIHEQGYEINIAKYRASEHYTQAVFSGGGISFAEDLLKMTGIEEFHVQAAEEPQEVDFSGLECRWQKVSQPGKEVITLLAKSNPHSKHSQDIYRDVLYVMRDIFGFDEKTNPIDTSSLKMNMSPSRLMGEIKFRTAGKSILHRLFYTLKIEFQIVIGKILMALGYKTSATDWSLYKPDIILNSDHRKFDDMLRVVISGTTEQRRQLESYLEQQYQQKRLAYGLNITDAAMITCMVFQYHREHVHFVDGANGGYVSASKGLKARMLALTNN